MSNEKALEAANAVVDGWQGALGSALNGVYLYGSAVSGNYRPGFSDVNLLAVVDQEVTLPDLWPAFTPVWHAHKETLGRAPWIVNQASLTRLAMLQPNLAAHWRKSAQALTGPQLLPAGPDSERSDSHVRLADTAMHLSSLVAPLHLDVKTRSRRQGQLRRLSHSLDPAGFDPEAADIAHLVVVYDHLAPLLPDPIAGDSLPSEPPELLPGLLAIYEFLDQLLLVWPQLDGADLERLNWPEIGERIAEDYSGVLVASRAQLDGIVSVTQPVSLALEQYQLVWGQDVLAGRVVDDKAIFHQLSLQATMYQVDQMPDAYLTTPKAEMSDLIHDLQNRLLNLRLRHELMRRMREWAPAATLDPLPGREMPSPGRVNAIQQRAGYWADYYAARLGQPSPPE